MKIRVLMAFAKKELGQTLRDPRMRTMLFLAPVIQLTLFGLALHNETRNIQLAVYAPPSDTLTWEIAHRAEGGGWFHLVKPSSADPFEALQAGQADAALVAPPGGLTLWVKRGHGDVQLLVDGTNTVRAAGVQGYLDRIRQDVIKERVMEPGTAQPPTIDLVERVLYNPTLESKNFMVPGVLVMLLLMTSLTITSTSISREKEGGTFETLMASPITPAEILLGKSLPFLGVGFFSMHIVLLVATQAFHVPFRGTFLDLWIASLAFLMCSVSLGVLVSTQARNQQQAMMGTFLFMYPAQMLSGITYPLDNMPPWLYTLTYLNPLRYFAILVRNILLKGGSPELFWPNVAGLLILGSFLMALAWSRFKPTMN
jgi:ABC-2 type transport system permease protein